MRAIIEDDIEVEHSLPVPSAEMTPATSPAGGMSGATRNLAYLLPTITQLSLIGSAMIVSYGYPLLFGLSAYGTFAAATSLTFIVQRLVDLIAELTLAERDPFKLVKSSLILAAGAMLLLLVTRAIIPSVAAVPFDLLLFASVFLSTVILNLCFQIGTPTTQSLYAISFGACNFLTTLAWYLLGRTDLALALTITNLFGLAVGILLLTVGNCHDKAHWTRGRSNRTMLRQLPFRVMFATFQIIITFGAVLIGSFYLPPQQVGGLRLLTSFAVLGYSLSPMNPKALYAISRAVERPADLGPILRPYVPVFLALGAGWAIAAFVIGRAGTTGHGHIYLYALAIYPIVLFSSILEKVLLNRKGITALGSAAFLWAVVTATALLLCRQIENYAFVLILAVAGYPFVLAFAFARSFLLPTVFVSVLAGLGYFLISGNLLGVVIMAAAAAIFAMLIWTGSQWTR